MERGGGSIVRAEDARHCSVLYICKYFVMSTFGFEIHMFLAGKDDLPRLVEVDGGQLQASLADRSLLAENRDHRLKW